MEMLVQDLAGIPEKNEKQINSTSIKIFEMFARPPAKKKEDFGTLGNVSFGV